MAAGRRGNTRPWRWGRRVSGRRAASRRSGAPAERCGRQGAGVHRRQACGSQAPLAAAAVAARHRGASSAGGFCSAPPDACGNLCVQARRWWWRSRMRASSSVTACPRELGRAPDVWRERGGGRQGGAWPTSALWGLRWRRLTRGKAVQPLGGAVQPPALVRRPPTPPASAPSIPACTRWLPAVCFCVDGPLPHMHTCPCHTISASALTPALQHTCTPNTYTHTLALPQRRAVPRGDRRAAVRRGADGGRGGG